MLYSGVSRGTKFEFSKKIKGEALDARNKLREVTSPGPHAGPVIIGPALGLLVLWWYCIKYKERALGWY